MTIFMTSLPCRMPWAFRNFGNMRNGYPRNSYPHYPPHRTPVVDNLRPFDHTPVFALHGNQNVRYSRRIDSIDRPIDEGAKDETIQLYARPHHRSNDNQGCDMSYADEQPIILSSARKPHIVNGIPVPPVPDEVILHAYAHGEDVGVNAHRDPPTYMVVGPDPQGNRLYEIGYFEAPYGADAGRIMICHAMPARRSYQNRYWNAIWR
ncbi:hypothetical protein JS533_000860 [Bifidobacterium amazonense]|uniref:Uncharacterized protein n=1 Tax=Bifidobacterium amazonense TaxID=2809027 RepID=A0ABS9VSE2_9BIFI|nr:hypothetical protein [Bifidobacterium amazonense]MCH9274841.1 hypothetical protein [Bifidobacterium amazonense]